MARPREPISLIVSKGRKHLTKTEIAERENSEVIVPCDNVFPPTFLTSKEKKKFTEIAKQLLDSGIMTNLDVDALARYIRADSEYIKVARQLSKIKFVPDKTSQINEEDQIDEQLAKYAFLQKIQDKAQKQCLVCARELGLTISSRCRLVMPKVDESPPENKFLKRA